MKRLPKEGSSAEKSNSFIEFTGNYAAILAAIEIGIGSIVHSLRIPFSGNLLSLNQTLVLARVTRLSKQRQLSASSPFAVSVIVSIFKSLSPAGNKLGPMLSISMQGLLFNLGTFLFGRTLVGVMVGGVIAAIWAFVQPIITLFVFFGTGLFDALWQTYEKLAEKIGMSDEIAVYSVLSLIGLKMIFGAFIAIVGFRMGAKAFAKYETKVFEKVKQFAPSSELLDPNTTPNLKMRLKGTWRDMTRPIFLISLAFTAVYFFFSRSDYATSIWLLLRPVAIAFLFFFCIRSLPIPRMIAQLEGTRLNGLARAMEVSFNKLTQLDKQLT